jgi:hypothetical protein
MSVIDQALALAERYPVFPCAEDKAPDTDHGFKDASQDPETIRRMFKRRSSPLIGVPTGDLELMCSISIRATEAISG